MKSDCYGSVMYVLMTWFLHVSECVLDGNESIEELNPMVDGWSAGISFFRLGKGGTCSWTNLVYY